MKKYQKLLMIALALVLSISAVDARKQSEEEYWAAKKAEFEMEADDRMLKRNLEYQIIDEMNRESKVAYSHGFKEELKRRVDAAYQNQKNDKKGKKGGTESCSSDNKDKREELTPAEKECLKDVGDFIFSYRIIKGIHDRFEKESGYPVPDIVKRDLEEADDAYNALKKYLTKTSLYTREVLNGGSILLPLTGFFVTTPQWALAWCKEMYNQEMNELFGTHFSQTSEDPFLESNLVCHTSYKDALRKVRAIRNKYESGQHTCR